MGREIKFRGKNTINGNWVYGYYFVEEGIHKIHSGHTVYSVHPNSVGQCLGLKDKNGEEIYEHDIVEWSADNHWNSFGGKSKEKRIDIVEYFEHGFEPFIFSEGYGGVEMINYRDCEVIDNIHENT